MSLRTALIKDVEKFPIFDALFSLFFGPSTPNVSSHLTQELIEEEAEILEQALKHMSEYLRQILERLIRTNYLDINDLEYRSTNVDPRHIVNYPFQEEMSNRSRDLSSIQDLQNAIRQLVELLIQMGLDQRRVMEIEQKLFANPIISEEQWKKFIGQYLAGSPIYFRHEERYDDLLYRPIYTLSEAEFAQLREQVRRLTEVLRTKISLRLRRAKRGSLDPKATIRANIKFQSVPFEIKRKNHDLKPYLVVMCDLSTSVRAYSELMLSIIHELQGQVRKTQAFAFIDHLEYITPDFIGKGAKQAIASVLHKMPPGHYNTNLGYSLQDFMQNYGEFINHHTTFVILGDGRNNYNDPRVDLMQEIQRRCHRVIWFNPEAPYLWGKGDSDIPKYIPFCDRIFHVSIVSELADAIDQLLT